MLEEEVAVGDYDENDDYYEARGSRRDSDKERPVAQSIQIFTLTIH